MGITRHYILPLSWLNLLYIAEYATLHLLLKNIKYKSLQEGQCKADMSTCTGIYNSSLKTFLYCKFTSSL